MMDDEMKNSDAVTMVVCGTVMLVPSRSPEFYRTILSPKLKEKIRQGDISVCDLETCFTSSPEHVPKAVNLVVPPGYASVIKDWGFTHTNCVHNHSLDAGPKGFQDSLAALVSVGLRPLSGGKGLSGADHEICTVRGKRVAMLSYCAIGELGDTYDAYDTARKEIPKYREQSDVVVVFYHDGFDLAGVPLPSQQKRYRTLLDVGADVLLVNQAHVFQGFERYQGRLIFHSTGNFVVYDTSDARWASTNRGAVISIAIHKDEIVFELLPIMIADDLSVSEMTAANTFRGLWEERAAVYASIRHSRWNQLRAAGAIAKPFLTEQIVTGLTIWFRKYGFWRGLKATRFFVNRFYAFLVVGLILRTLGFGKKLYPQP